HRRGNAVGPVWIVCRDDMLEIECTHVRRYSGDFVMLGAAETVHVRVPFRAVRGLLRQGPLLHLSLDPRCAAPYNRFVLARFRAARHGTSQSRRQLRLLAGLQFFTWLGPLLLSLAAFWALRSEMSDAATWSLAAATFVVSRLSCRAWYLRVAYGAARSERLAARLQSAIEQRLGLSMVPGDMTDPALLGAGPELAPKPRLGEALGVNSRVSRLAAAAAVSALGVAIGLALLMRFGVAERVVLPVGHLDRGLPAQTGDLVARAAAYGRPKHPSCRCQQPDLPAFRRGVSRLSLLVLPRQARFATLELAANRTHVARFEGQVGSRPPMWLQLAAINNGGQALDSINLVVTFARRNAKGERRVVVERGLHWPGILQPGAAVKWKLSGRGTEIKIHSRIDERLTRSEMAPTGAFASLASANTAAVRVHGAAMLTYLGAEGAGDAVSALSRLTANPSVLAARDSLRVAFLPLRACDVRLDDGVVGLCIDNASTTLHRKLLLKGGLEATLTDWFIPGMGLSFRLPSVRLGPEAVRVVVAEKRKEAH
ncbi:MAG: hypothetical protein VB934_18745, partial [Polyangiaceae bacterium]